MKFKAVSFNVCHFENYLTGKIDYDAFADVIKAFDTDIVGLNEVRGNGIRDDYEPQADIMSEKTGYSAYFAKATDIDGCNPYGNGVLTRMKIKECSTIPIPDPEPKAYDGYYETRCILKISLCDPDVTFFITHFGLNPDEQQNAVNTLLSSVEGENVVIMGDMNVLPDSHILDPLRRRFTDSASVTDKALLTFPSDKPEGKIDYIFTGSAVRTLSVEVPELILSDHRPIIATFEI